MGSTADQYQDRPAGVFFCFGIPRYASHFDFSRPKFPYFAVVSYTPLFVLSVYLLGDAVCSSFLQ